MRAYNHEFPKNGSEIFLPQGLDRANQVDFVRKNRRLAQGFSAAHCGSAVMIPISEHIASETTQLSSGPEAVLFILYI
jgi:hypothetical protein